MLKSAWFTKRITPDVVLHMHPFQQPKVAAMSDQSVEWDGSTVRSDSPDFVVGVDFGTTSTGKQAFS